MYGYDSAELHSLPGVRNAVALAGDGAMRAPARLAIAVRSGSSTAGKSKVMVFVIAAGPGGTTNGRPAQLLAQVGAACECTCSVCACNHSSFCMRMHMQNMCIWTFNAGGYRMQLLLSESTCNHSTQTACKRRLACTHLTGKNLDNALVNYCCLFRSLPPSILLPVLHQCCTSAAPVLHLLFVILGHIWISIILH